MAIPCDLTVRLHRKLKIVLYIGIEYLMVIKVIAVSASDVFDSLKAVKLDKAACIDRLSSYHFVCGHTGIRVHIPVLVSTYRYQCLED